MSLFELTVRAVEAVAKRTLDDTKELILAEAKLVEFPTIAFAIESGEIYPEYRPERTPGIILTLPIHEVPRSEHVVLTPDGIFECSLESCKAEPSEEVINRFSQRPETTLKLKLMLGSESPVLYLRYAKKALEAIASLPRKE